MTSFCTYFDRNYLPQGLALYRSLTREQPGAELWVLCLDEETQSILVRLELERAHTVTVDDLVRLDPRLVQAKGDRSLLEFYYACTPQVVRYVAEQREGEAVAYVDADVLFFGDPSGICRDSPGAEILLMEHRSGDSKALSERGRFNLCFVHLEPTDNARRALRWWCDATIESTAMNSETWGDQKYLDRFPEMFHSVGVLRSPATTLAPWNVYQHEFSLDKTGRVHVDGEPLIAYHFARMLIAGPHLFTPARREWLPGSVLEWIYRPYMREIRASFERIREIVPGYSVRHMRKNKRGLVLGVLFGRIFYEGPSGLHRLGVYIPNTRKELRARRQAAQRQRSIEARAPMADARSVAGGPGERLPARLQLKRTGVNRLRWIRKTRIVRDHGAPIGEHLRYVLFDPELQNFTYEIANREELSNWLDGLFGAGQYVEELDRNTDLSAAVRRRVRWRPASKPIIPFGRRAGWYSIVRALRPAKVVETGTHDGLGSTAILAALERNGSGELASIDPQPGTGWLVPDELRGRWRPIRAASYDALQSVGQIDLFIHDSLHTPECERWELETAVRLGAGVLLSDNAHAADTARQFARERGGEFSVWRERVQDHFYPGGGIGVIVLEPAREASGAQVS